MPDFLVEKRGKNMLKPLKNKGFRTPSGGVEDDEGIDRG